MGVGAGHRENQYFFLLKVGAEVEQYSCLMVVEEQEWHLCLQVAEEVGQNLCLRVVEDALQSALVAYVHHVSPAWPLSASLQLPLSYLCIFYETFVNR